MLYCGDNALWAVPLTNPPPLTTVSHCWTVQFLWRRANTSRLLMFACRNSGFLTATQPRIPAEFRRFLIVEDDTVTPSDSALIPSSVAVLWIAVAISDECLDCRTDVLFGLPLRGLSATDPVSPSFLMPYTVFTFTFSCRLTSRQPTPISISTTALVRNSVLVFL